MRVTGNTEYLGVSFNVRNKIRRLLFPYNFYSLFSCRCGCCYFYSLVRIFFLWGSSPHTHTHTHAKN